MAKKGNYTALVIYPETNVFYERREFVGVKTSSPVCFDGNIASHHYFTEFPEKGEKCFCGKEKYEEQVEDE